MYENNGFEGNGQVGGNTNGNVNGYGSNMTQNTTQNGMSGTTQNMPQYNNQNMAANSQGQAQGNGYGTAKPQSSYETYYSQSSTYQQPANVISDTAKTKKEQRAKSHFMRKALACAGFGLFFGMCTGLGFYGVYQGTGMAKQIKEGTANYDTRVTNAVSTTNVTSDGENTKTLSDDSQKAKLNISYSNVDSDISQVVDRVMPAMVSIVNHTTTYENFFGQRYAAEAEASGSGIIVAENDEELLIVTNHHVAANANALDITFIDGSTAEAKPKGSDADMDLAVLAVLKSDLSDETMSKIVIASLGDSDSLKLGEPVIAIGNALGYGQSVTNGIVSALNRELEMDDGTSGKFIQTNAAINPGNSGGALLNMNGEVIGINSNKIGGTAIEGMGYAIPINSASPIIDELMQRKTLRNEVKEEDRGYFGLNLQNINAEYASAYNIPVGAVVMSVEEDGPAASAGIKERDIITKVEGSRISQLEELQEILKYYSAGDEVEVVVMRQNEDEFKEVTLKVTLGQRPQKKANNR